MMLCISEFIRYEEESELLKDLYNQENDQGAYERSHKKISKGIQLNMTAILTLDQVEETVQAFKSGTKNIVSVFAGRIADSGIDPIPTMKEAAKICSKKEGTELLWASSRELLNIMQADACGCSIITCSPDILNKLENVGKDLKTISLDTVKMFNKDVQELGYSII
ncbi:transaldolase [Streptomyces afghaniensis]